jgi:hypothetical protein
MMTTLLEPSLDAENFLVGQEFHNRDAPTCLPTTIGLMTFR